MVRDRITARRGAQGLRNRDRSSRTGTGTERQEQGMGTGIGKATNTGTVKRPGLWTELDYGLTH